MLHVRRYSKTLRYQKLPNIECRCSSRWSQNFIPDNILLGEVEDMEFSKFMLIEFLGVLITAEFQKIF